MPARSACLVTLSLSEAGPGRFGRQVSVTDIYHIIPYHIPHLHALGIVWSASDPKSYILYYPYKLWGMVQLLGC